MSVVIGKLKHPYAVAEESGDTVGIEEWSYRAMWSYLRLQYGRQVDKEIQDYQDNFARSIGKDSRLQLSSLKRMELLRKFFEGRTDDMQDPRKTQFIMFGREVAAVASLKHLLIPPEDVYAKAREILKQTPEKDSRLWGDIYMLKQLKTVNLGLQVFAGTITTRQAIKVCSTLRINECFNPLSWLGTGSFSKGFGTRHPLERVLRIKQKSDLEPRLRAAISQAQKRLVTLREILEGKKRVELTLQQGKRIFTAISWSYNVGVYLMKQVFEALDPLDNTLYGWSMAASWVAEHGTPRQEGFNITQRLASVAAAMLMVKDVEAAESDSVAWLKAHIKEGSPKTLQELAKELELV